MSANVIVIGPRDRGRAPKGSLVINTTSRSERSLWTQLSPFHLGPCKLWGGHISENMENGWQYSKVYHEHNLMSIWLKWAKQGWANKRAVRYPMGKGAAPKFSYWDGANYSYVEARSRIYIPLYARAVRRTEAFAELKRLYRSESEIYLWDFDGRDREKRNETLIQVLTNPKQKMGHAFVLAMMLEWGSDFYRE